MLIVLLFCTDTPEKPPRTDTVTHPPIVTVAVHATPALAVVTVDQVVVTEVGLEADTIARVTPDRDTCLGIGIE